MMDLDEQPTATFYRFKKSIRREQESSTMEDVEDVSSSVSAPTFETESIPIFTDTALFGEHRWSQGMSRKRKRLVGRAAPAGDDVVIMTAARTTSSSSSKDQALSIDLVVSHIIGFLPWKEQIVVCRCVSSTWREAARSAPLSLLFVHQTNRKEEGGGQQQQQQQQQHVHIRNEYRRPSLVPPRLTQQLCGIPSHIFWKMPASDRSRIHTLMLPVYQKEDPEFEARMIRRVAAVESETRPFQIFRGPVITLLQYCD